MIKVNNLTKIYKTRNTADRIKFLFGNKTSQRKQVKAVNDVSFEINKGEIVGFIGPNGAGKTTTIKMLTGLLKPTAGNIKIGNFSPFELTKEFKLKIGLFRGETHILDDGVIIKDSLKERLKIYEKKDLKLNKFVNQLLEITEIEKFLDDVPENLSQGQRSLIEFVASIIHAPEYIFLDEPTNGLDINAIIRFKNVIQFINKKHKSTILITSHNLQHVVDLSDRLILINKGKVLIDKPTERVIHSDTLDRTIKFCVDSKEGTTSLPKNMSMKYPWITVAVNKKNLEKEIRKGLDRFKVIDIRISEPPVEEIFSKYYS